MFARSPRHAIDRQRAANRRLPISVLAQYCANQIYVGMSTRQQLPTVVAVPVPSCRVDTTRAIDRAPILRLLPAATCPAKQAADERPTPASPEDARRHQGRGAGAAVRADPHPQHLHRPRLQGALPAGGGMVRPPARATSASRPAWCRPPGIRWSSAHDKAPPQRRRRTCCSTATTTCSRPTRSSCGNRRRSSRASPPTRPTAR